MTSNDETGFDFGDPGVPNEDGETWGEAAERLREQYPAPSGTVVAEFEVGEDHMVIDEAGRYQLVKLQEDDR